MPVTALQHFTEDIARARAIVTHADPLPHASRCDVHINTEFREFLVGVGCSVATITQAGY